MAKQTFTTGQVLTAAQMTSLQQTAMLGGAASAKVASYTLVAADAGTAISMSNASATTITVNTALFAAGDTVQITNLGAGVCTITAGTATVNTSSSLALAQYEGGTLSFTSTSAAIFIKGDAAAATSGANWSLLNSGGTSLSAGTTTISSISGKDKIMVLVENASTDSSGSAIRFQVNTLATAIYTTNAAQFTATSTYAASNATGSDERGTTSIVLASMGANAAANVDAAITLTGCNSSGVKQFIFNAGGSDGGSSNNTIRAGQGFINTTATISSISILVTSGSFDAGTVYVYASA
jgi:hypothetical protein